jgi:protease I
MEKKLKGKKIAVLIADGVELSEITIPVSIINESGGEVGIISYSEKVNAMDEEKASVEFTTDAILGKVNPDIFDALLLPGGVMEEENLRMNNKAIAFVEHFVKNHKPIAALSYGQWILIEAQGVKNKRITSDPTIKEDFIHAGAKWLDKNMVEDENILTIQGIGDLSEFNNAMIELFSKSEELTIKELNKEENKDKRLNLHHTDSIGENPTKKWGVSEIS